MMSEPEKIIPVHGGYRKLKSFQVPQLAYDVTVRFCDRYIEKRSRTHDQMVQAARSGVQNIAEGSQASGTSKKMEMKLTNVARASLEELRLDYEDFLRQRGLPQWPREDARRAQLIARRPATADDVARWARDVRVGQDGRHGQSGQSGQKQKPMESTQFTVSTVSDYPEIAANGVLALSRWRAACWTARSPRRKKRLRKRAVSPSGFTGCGAKGEIGHERILLVRSPGPHHHQQASGGSGLAFPA